jgi:nicotinic acid phosphoribosyltransferase
MRPDSGDPTVEPGLVGHDLKNTFGYTVNEKGKFVLAPSVGVIQGDGIRVDTFEGVVRGWIDAGFSLDNFALGMGSGVTHDGARDDFSFSFKATANCANGYWERLMKDPNTDPTKKSLCGLVYCMEDRDGNLKVYDALDSGEKYDGGELFKTGPGWRSFYKDGFRQYRQSFDDVRARARA